MNVPWVEKYRPDNYNDFISHNNITDIIKKLLDKDNFHHLIFYGPPGIGKTTLINIILKNIYGSEYKSNILELNGSDDRGISVVRDKIKNYANSNNIFNNKFKIVVLDEVDSMTDDAQNALKEIIENYEKNTKFCLICNFINKIIYQLQTCCIIFRLSPINNIDIKRFLFTIIKNEKIKYTNDGINTLINYCHGDLRLACNNLQSIYLAYENINKNNVINSLGILKKSDLDNIFIYIKQKNLSEYSNFVKNLKLKNGYSLQELINNIYPKILYEINLSNEKLIDVILHISNIEFNNSNLGTERIQIYSLISVLYKLKEFL